MYQIRIHPVLRYSRYFLCVGALVTLVGFSAYETLWLAVVGLAIFIVGFALQFYMNRLVSKYKVRSSLSLDFLFPETDQWRVAPELVAMPEEEFPTEAEIKDEERAELIRAIRTRSRKRRNAAARLATCGPSVVPEVVPLLREQHHEVRVIGASILRYMGPRAAAAVSVLMKTLEDSDAMVRAEAVCALARISHGATEAVPALTLLLDDSDENVRICAAIAIGAINPAKSPRREAIDALEKRRQDPVHTVQVAATLSLQALGETDDRTVPVLVEGLRDHNAIIALLCTETLGLIGDPAKEAVPPLVEALGAQHPVILIKVSHALYRLGYDPLALLRHILLCARTGEIYVRLEALNILEEMGPKAEPATAAYVRMLADRGALTRLVAVRAIAFLGEGARPLAPQLRRCVTDQAKAVSFHAKRILESLGEPLAEPEAKPPVGKAEKEKAPKPQSEKDKSNKAMGKKAKPKKAESKKS
jgi:HEAT repeat protein